MGLDPFLEGAPSGRAALGEPRPEERPWTSAGPPPDPCAPCCSPSPLSRPPSCHRCSPPTPARSRPTRVSPFPARTASPRPSRISRVRRLRPSRRQRSFPATSTCRSPGSRAASASPSSSPSRRPTAAGRSSSSRAAAIRLIRKGVLQSTPFLDLRSKVSTGGERGLLGLAFHPDYSRTASST